MIVPAYTGLIEDMAIPYIVFVYIFFYYFDNINGCNT
jgi:hypothetical protein